MTKYYSYYHCTDGCSCRFRADKVKQTFVGELKKYIPRPEIADLFKQVLAEAWKEQTNHLNDDANSCPYRSKNSKKNYLMSGSELK